MPLLGVIPARLGSTRLPQKPLQLLAGAPLVIRVLQRVREQGIVDRLVVATDAQSIADVVRREGGEAVLTHDRHLTGTERVAEVASRPEFAGYDVIANIQGDEPFITGEALERSVGRMEAGDEVGTAAAPLALAFVEDPARVKVVTDLRGRALYFSRSVIPHRREHDDPAEGLYWQHLGIYVYTRPALRRWVALPPTDAEQAERLEQLRALQNGMTIGVAKLSEPALPGIDTLEDLRRAEHYWLAHQR
jgi:3-deoxy-manno-octulosonate cytidylyltransferase (CMP-KDO synthetase)